MALNRRNYPPDSGIRVPADVHAEFFRKLLLGIGMDEDGAALVTGYLVACDTRHVFSHGTKRAMDEYLPKTQEGRINPRPQVKVERDDGATVVIDGDGGLGYFACDRAMELINERARQFGVGAATTYNHHHFGAAGNWTRRALEQGFVGYASSCHRFKANPDQVVTRAVGSSPMSIAIPAGHQPPFVLDMGGLSIPGSEEMMEQAPQAFFKALGIGSVSVILGGVLAGIWREEAVNNRWESNQGSFLTAWDIGRFMDPEQFSDEMDRHVAEVRSMQPFPGMDRAELPGGMEHAWERESREAGIPISEPHRQKLEEWGERLSVASPYSEYEHTRFGG